ncbi:MAG: LCP family protein [Lachnospiraceae bacterium]|nr:LCP family protein [Lachnospiraceae bacterium]
MKINVRVYRIIAKAILAVVVTIFVGVVVFVGLQISGKNRLYKDVDTTGPHLDQVALAGTEAGDGSATGSADGSANGTEASQQEPVEEDNWQEGDVRYQGVHYRYNSEVLTFLFMGIDRMTTVKEAKDGNDGGQSDALFMLVLDPHTKEATIIGIPRDTMADVAVYNDAGNYVGNTMAQITLQHAYGDGKEVSCERSVEAVSKLFYDLPIHGYCAINMGAIPLINDAVGGVEVTALEDVYNSNIKKGQTILLKGQDAYKYLHNRDTKSAESAMRRQERQKQYLTAYADTALTAMKKDVTLPVTLYNTISKYMVTDITLDEVSFLATQASGYHFGGDNIHTLSGEVKMGEEYEEFYVDEAALYELIIDVFYEEVK